MTAEDIAGARIADDAVRSSGYAPELKRTLGPFQTFAISFAFISVLVAIFATYGAVLQSSGPVGVWLWILAAVGQTLVALVVAQFAARIALSGSPYQWASRLANPKVGWWFGWLTFWFLAIGLMFLAAVLVIASTRLLGMLSSTAVGLELAILAVVIVGFDSAANLAERRKTRSAAFRARS